MTEAEWLVGANSLPMLSELREVVSPRKAMLFAVACCRRVWRLLPSAKEQALVEVTERLAEGTINFTEWEDAVAIAPCEPAEGDQDLPMGRAAYAASHLLSPPDFQTAWMVAFHTWAAMQLAEGPEAPRWFLKPCALPPWGWMRPFPEPHPERAIQACLLRCVVGNLFHSVLLVPAHRTPIVVSLASAASEARLLPSGEMEPLRLAVLADALEEIGAPAELVSHLRGSGPHVRGCFAIDLCLGLT